MNRVQRRAEAAREKMERNANRVQALVEERNEARQIGEQFRLLLFALARREGRVRVRLEDIQALGENDRLDFAKQPNGDVLVEFRSGGTA